MSEKNELQSNPDTNENETSKISEENFSSAPSANELRYKSGTAVDPFAEKNEDASIEKHLGNDLADNDGSIPATLDTAFHGFQESGEEKIPTGNLTDHYNGGPAGNSDDNE